MTSNERSFPWDDHNGDREYGSDEFAEFFSTLFKPGVVATANFGSGLQIKESASLGMRVVFGAGEAFSSFGRNYVHDKDEEVTIPIASTLQDRTDSVAIQFNKSEREAFFVYKESDTTVTRTDSIFELQIAKIVVPKNSTQITNANITDMRANETVCGYFSPHGKLNAGEITAQFIAWFDDFKGKLGTDPATNLQLQIDDLDSKTVHKTGDENIDGNKNFTGDTEMNNLELTGTLTRPNKKVLLSGAYWMQAGQVVTPSKAISDCENGWILHFTSYNSGMTGETKNGNNHYFYVPKEQVNIADVGTMFPLVVQDGTMTLKYLYLQNNKITGNAANESTNSKKYVLQHVLEY